MLPEHDEGAEKNYMYLEVRIYYSRPVQPTTREHFLHSWTYLFAHQDFYSSKPGPNRNKHETTQNFFDQVVPIQKRSSKLLPT